MAYGFKAASGVASQVREIATEQVDTALETIRVNADFDETVHSLRKACKKLRALLKLVRPEFADYEAENAAIRSIAEQFSVARDAAVMVQTLSGLIGADAADAERQLLQRLQERAGHLQSQIGEKALLSNAAEQFEALKGRIEKWRFDASGVDIILPGLKKSYARFRNNFALARHEPDGEVMHEWRKAAKAYWYHVRLLKRAAPAVLESLTVELDALGEKLGDHHNLAVLAASIDTAPRGGEGLDHLREAIATRQSELAEQSFVLARQLIVEKPSALSDRYRRYWQLLG